MGTHDLERGWRRLSDRPLVIPHAQSPLDGRFASDVSSGRCWGRHLSLDESLSLFTAPPGEG